MAVKRKRKAVLLIVIGIILIALIIWIAWGNTALTISEFTITGDRIPESFSGFRIAHVSDLHNAQFGENNAELLDILQKSDPDIIVITGDLVDSYDTDIEVALQFANDAMKIAPCYYVTGNHEARISEYHKLKAGLESADVAVLENDRIELERSGEKITLIGVDDPSFKTDYLFGDASAVMTTELNELYSDNNSYTILLSHRPELFDAYTECGLDLVFSGHAHGGQFRIPFVGGIAAPNQGLFPEYDSGLYTDGRTNMIVSRGVGNSIIPFRINNRPEIVVAELRRPD